MTPLQLLFLGVFGLAAIWFGWRVFRTKSMVRSALSLLAAMVALGGMFLALDAEFLGVLQIMMMAGEMSIMAFFMMMYMMDPGGMSSMNMTHQQRPAAAVGIGAGVLVLALALLTPWPPAQALAPSATQQNHDLGIELMTRSMMIFETAGTSILVAMIAAVATALAYPQQPD
ncbi:hypothetical protein E4631_20290 [Hymenobacter sp. UV11]|uniref:NADH-quinone oxidoreductase subunit J family protein n=1 Tax=Hymenobacter sp. UV11 TaxID=1849735 RepID=UPI001060B6FA|nr:NADH-quinone oxidoreductase subunit J [Hymenobacter sp. UV11]TDN36907.1 hypothetical protein A8B98_05780 [Hymenobacter sp. UV11]TFZ64337.1 hypothetical protein E4631_20290 [Hymenobacter sp. UV11]